MYPFYAEFKIIDNSLCVEMYYHNDADWFDDVDESLSLYFDRDDFSKEKLLFFAYKCTGETDFFKPRFFFFAGCVYTHIILCSDSCIDFKIGTANAGVPIKIIFNAII